MYTKYLIKAVLLFGLIGICAIACSNTPAPEISSTAISISESFDSAAAQKTAVISSAEDDSVLSDPRVTITVNYQPTMSLLGKVHDDYSGKHFTYQQLTDIAEKLGIPDNTEVDVCVSDSYTWEAAGIDLAEVSFYRENTYVAGAECEVNTSNLARSICKYEY